MTLFSIHLSNPSEHKNYDVFIHFTCARNDIIYIVHAPKPPFTQFYVQCGCDVVMVEIVRILNVWSSIKKSISIGPVNVSRGIRFSSSHNNIFKCMPYAIPNCTHIWRNKWPRKKPSVTILLRTVSVSYPHRFPLLLFLLIFRLLFAAVNTFSRHRAENWNGSLLVFPLERLVIFITSFMTMLCISAAPEQRKTTILRLNRIEHFSHTEHSFCEDLTRKVIQSFSLKSTRIVGL